MEGCVHPDHLVLRERGYRSPRQPRASRHLRTGAPRGRRPLSVIERVWRGVIAQPAPPSVAARGPCLVPTKQKPGTRGDVNLLIAGHWHPAHRLAYELANDVELPRDLVRDHACEVKSCRAPLHIEPVTQRENVRRDRSRRAERLALAERVT